MPDSEQALTGQPWTRSEVEAAVEDYFHMLRLELLGQRFNKSAHRRALQKHLRGRSEGSIEMKHQNISAALMDMGVMPLRGYTGLPNYQDLVAEVVAEQLAKDEKLDHAAISAVSKQAEEVLMDGFADFVVAPPKPRGVKEPGVPVPARLPVKRDYLEREARNRSLGAAGEKLIMEFEAQRLYSAGLKKLADRIEHTAHVKGDGAGYDILSFDLDGRERFIEVKTTAYAETTPFFASRNEVRFSEASKEQFYLYRVFDFRERPRMFQLPGDLNATCRLDPVSYWAIPHFLG